ncbi:VirK family protein [Legionella cardiaca]|uniref:VirK family protein n=1 Tax=Legionella cardiaca TaxID=1071983 RepID=A0ABY8AS47_9GAMM|nr:VirK family protein [Legionella cardiaca]WED43504.1 VirK family protein [Legionella cardiaca]
MQAKDLIFYKKRDAMKKYFTTILAILSLNSYAEELKSFSAVAKAVTTGKLLTFVWTAKACTSDSKLPDVITAVKPNAIMLIANQRITASDRHFTMNDPALPDTPAFIYSKFNLRADGQAMLTMTLMQAKDYSSVKSYQIQCTLGSGLTIFD